MQAREHCQNDGGKNTLSVETWKRGRSPEVCYYLTIILRGRAGYEMIYITNEASSAELVMIISYPASPSRIIVLLKTPTSQLFYVEFIWPFFLGAAKLCICCCVHWPYLVVQVYELITCARQANKNAGNVISVVQFLIILFIVRTTLELSKIDWLYWTLRANIYLIQNKMKISRRNNKNIVFAF